MFPTWSASLNTKTLAWACLLGVAYLLGAELGHLLSLKIQDQTFATFWPPAGLLFAACVSRPRSDWPALFAAACVANLASDVLLHEKSFLASLGFCMANCMEACIGAWFLVRFAILPLTLARLHDVMALTLLAVLVSPVVGATLGAGVVSLTYQAPYWAAWRVWWSADALGVLFVAPVVFTWATRSPALLRNPRPWRIVETVGLFLGLALMAQSIFGDWLPRSLALPMLLFPFLLWVGLRFDPFGAAAAILLIVVIALGNTVQGRGHYSLLAALPGDQIVRAQIGLCIMSCTLLLFAAVAAERKQAEQQRLRLIHQLEQALAEVKTLRGLIPICAYCKKIRDDQGFWNRLENHLLEHTEATQFTHGTCPQCFDEQIAQLQRDT